MNEEQKQPIPLNAQFDFNSNDMLVKIAQPKFAFNRQRFLASLLQTSVRYEDDGWFAGWWVHKFNLTSTRNDSCTPPLNDNAELVIYERVSYEGFNYYIVQHQDTGLIYVVNPSLWSNWIVGTGTIVRLNDSTVNVTGLTKLGDSVSVEVNPYTGDLISFTQTGSGLTCTTSKDGYVIRVAVERSSTASTDDMAVIRPNQPLSIGDSIIPYTRDSTTSTWGTLFKLTDAGVLTSIDPEFSVQSYNIIRAGFSNEHVHGIIYDETELMLTGEFQYVDKWVEDVFSSTTLAMEQVYTSTFIQNGLPVNTQDATLIWRANTGLLYNNACILEYMLPIWLSFKSYWNYGVTLDRSSNMPEPIDQHIIYQFDQPLEYTAAEFLTMVKAYNWLIPGDYTSHLLCSVSPDQKEYTISFTGSAMARYTTVTLNLPQLLRGAGATQAWDPYQNILNPAFDPRPSVAVVNPPYGCLPSTTYQPHTQQRNAAKYLAALPSGNPGIADTISTTPDYTQYIINAAVLDTVNNTAYQPDPLQPAFDPRPVVPVLGALPWTDPAISTANGAVNLNETITNPNYYVSGTWFYNTVRRWVSNDWAVISLHWADWWPTIDIPMPANNVMYPNNTTVSTTANLVVGMDPVQEQASNGTWINQPVDANDSYAPPRTAPYQGYLDFSWIGGDASIMALINGLAQVGCHWEWNITGTREYKRMWNIVIDKPWWEPSRDSQWHQTLWTRYWQNNDPTEYTSGRPVIWQPITQGVHRWVSDCMYGEPGHPNNTGTFAKDTWTLRLRCVNDNALYPATQYFQMDIDTNGFYFVNNIVWNAAHRFYKGSNGRYFQILNEVSPTDGAIWGYDLDNKQLNIMAPICVPGMAFLRINTPNILASNINAFSTALVNNSDPNLNVKCWRIDQTPDNFGLNLIKGSLSQIAPSGTNQALQTLTVLWESSRLQPMYAAYSNCYNVDLTSGAITSYYDQAFPAWCLYGPSAVMTGTPIIKPYSPSADTYTQVAITVNLKILGFIDNIVFTKDKNINSPYNTDLFQTIQPSFTASAPTVPTHLQSVRVFVDATNVELTGFAYNPDNTTVTTSTDIYNWWTHVSTAFASNKTDYNNNQVMITLKNHQDALNLDFYRTFLKSTTGLMLPVSIDRQTLANKLYFNAGYGYTQLPQGTLYDATQVTYVNSEYDVDSFLRIYVGLNNNLIVYFTPVGIIDRNNSDIIYDSIRTVPGFYQVTFEYDGTPHVLQIDRSLGASTFIRYTTTDIRTGETKELYRRDCKDVSMIIKQQWSSVVDTENYWWIDRNHILELTKYDVILKRKVAGKVDDWMGDVWEVESRAPRGIWLGTDDLYYSATSAYTAVNNGYSNALFFKLSNNQNKFIQIQWCDPLTVNFAEPAWITMQLGVSQVPLGVPLNNDICAYFPLDVNSLITTSRISSTHIGDWLLIGIAINKGLGQWTIKINTVARSWSRIVGYGYVGPAGELTGGELPAYACDANGFKETVYSVDTLPADSTDENPATTVVGTDSTIWFVRSNFGTIISHYLFNVSGTHTAITVPLNNNYIQTYQSSSTAGTWIHDLIPNVVNIGSLLGSSPGLSVIMAVITPTFYCLTPMFSVIGHIGHALGQYAYVWRTSEAPTTDPKKSDKHITWGKKSYKESFVLGQDGLVVMARIIIKQLGPIANGITESVINKIAGAPVADDTSERRYSQAFADNLVSSVGGEITTTSFYVNVRSELVRSFALNMFYNISNKSHVYAGPGFTNLDLKAQCVAISGQDIQAQGRQAAYWSTLVALSTVILKQQVRLMELTADKLILWGSGEVNSVIPVSPGVGAPIGQAIGGALIGAAAAIHGVMALQEAVLDALPQLGSAIGGYPKPDTYMNNQYEKHSVYQEGSHNYGNRSLSLYWPSFGIQKPNTIINEGVDYAVQTTEYNINFNGMNTTMRNWYQNGHRTIEQPTMDTFSGSLKGPIKSPYIMCKQASNPQVVNLPDNMAKVEGVASFLSPKPFRNEQIGLSDIVFAPPTVHDYMINKNWALGYTAASGYVVSVSVDDVKVMDGEPSNVVIDSTSFCGIASSYIALEVKQTYDPRYLRPVAVTPNSIGLNINRVNCVHDAKAYHAFDGQINRIVSWTGGVGMDKELLYQQYLFQVNDHFKRSNIFPPSQFFGDFQGPPSVAIRSPNEIVANLYQELSTNTGTNNDVPGEQKNLARFSLPIHSETLSTLPSVVRMLAPYKLHTVEGITSLCTDIRSTQTKYKAPTSVDFNINGDLYRQTEEYICSIQEKAGIVALQDLAVSAGLTFIGATTKEAFFFSQATKMYYSFKGQRDITKMDVMSRFKDVKVGRWDFINQEVMFQCLLNDNEEVLVIRLDGNVLGEVWPPNETIYNKRSGFKLFSVAGGLVYQGPKRCIVSRFITLDHMIPDIRANKRKWIKARREEFIYDRDYQWHYEDFDTSTPISAVKGWTHNPYLLVSSMLGTDEETDSKFEWQLTFAWTEQMDKIFDQNEYATVNIMAETVTQGGTVRQRPTHLFLFKECFTRMGNAGYYTTKFQSNNGVGNRERLFIWSDSFIALEDFTIACKNVTTNRTQPLHTQVDVKDLQEL